MSAREREVDAHHVDAEEKRTRDGLPELDIRLGPFRAPDFALAAKINYFPPRPLSKISRNPTRSLFPTMHTAALAARKAALRALLRPTVVARSYATPAVVKQNDDADPQLADYPSLPWISRQRLPPRGPYDDFQMRRNFGEPVRGRQYTTCATY